jgi:regulator of cell morphogenesis and NO signaling
MKMAGLIFENPALQLMMEHFELNYLVHEKNVQQYCEENNISKELFLSIANLYNGFHSIEAINFSAKDLLRILKYLKNSHNYYENEKYPEIRYLIDQLYLKNDTPEIKLIGKFFDEYFEEVKEHLSYENITVFPYFNKLLSVDKDGKNFGTSFSVNEYSEHHTDIESKLNDLKELLLKHIPVKNDRVLRRKIILSLFELEYDLNVHSLIEEMILIPAIRKLESKESVE